MGTLYIVATPIGNLSDITLRAIETLFTVDIIACEDTRKTGILLTSMQEVYNKLVYYTTEKTGKSNADTGERKLVSIRDENEEVMLYEILEYLNQGKSVALVSDAGTPLISDPGFKLVREARKKGIRVEPIPGASSVITALSASGLPTDKFLFLGFPPDSLGKKQNFFKKVQSTLEFSTSSNNINPTVIFFESPHKLLICLEALEEVFGDKEIVIAREMTKIHEEFLKDTVSSLRKHFEKNTPRGEFVILFHL